MECKTEFDVVPASSHVREDFSKESGNLLAAAVAFLGWAFSVRGLTRASWSTGKLDCVLEESAKWCETFGGIGECHVSATNIRDVFHDMCSVDQKRLYRICFEEVDHTRVVKACVLKEYSTCERLALVAAMEALMEAATPTYGNSGLLSLNLTSLRADEVKTMKEKEGEWKKERERESEGRGRAKYILWSLDRLSGRYTRNFNYPPIIELS